MTLKELYKMEPQEVTYDMDYLVANYGDTGKKPMPELSKYMNLHFGIVDHTETVEIRILRDWNMDYRRRWVAFTAFYEGEPFMFVQAAGRELNDYMERWVSNGELYEKALNHIIKLIEIEADSFYQDYYVEEDEEIDNPFYFYDEHVYEGRHYGSDY